MVAGDGPKGVNVRQRVAVVGCGHVGVVTAACLAELGHQVVGVDINKALIDGLRAGKVPFVEPGLMDLVVTNTGLGRLSFTTSYQEALAGAGFVFLCVNTPSTAAGAADLRYVRGAVAQIAGALSASNDRPLIVNKSTSPIGTGETIEAILGQTFQGKGDRPPIAANPEFLREGSAVYDFFHAERIVIGADSLEDARGVAALYEGIDVPIILTDIRTAEMVKYVSNAFLATRVSFVNEIAQLCEHLGIDIDVVVRGVSLDPRIGSAFFKPGIGYGGSCLPKDVAAMRHTGNSVGVAMRVLSSVQEVNIAQRGRAVSSIRRLLGPLEGLTVAAWGATFKGGSEDLRESPALDVITLLRNEGARVKVYDPALVAASSVDFADEICGDALEAARGAHCVAILTDWPEFADVDLDEVRRLMAGHLLYDGRNLLRRSDVEAAGLTYCGVGRPPTLDSSRVAEVQHVR
jgi:UDPglucose 6-dehydrogenase